MTFLPLLLAHQLVVVVPTVITQTYRSPDRYLSQNRSADPGVDMGIVLQPTYLFESPDANSHRIGRLDVDATTVLVSRDNVDGWTNVIQLSTGRQGWVRSGRLNLRYTRSPKPEMVFHDERASGDTPPVIKVKNSSDQPLYLHIANQPEYEVAPWSTRAIQLDPGAYAYNACSPGVIPTFGYRDFTNGGRYDWTFAISAGGYSANPYTNGPSASDRERQLRADVDRLGTERLDLMSKIDTDRTNYNRHHDLCDDDAAYIESRRQSVDEDDERAMRSFNRLVDRHNRDIQALRDQQRDLNAEIDRFNATVQELSRAKARLRRLEDKE